MRALRWTPLLLTFGCAHDLNLDGYWEIVAATRDGVTQEDVGFLDLTEAGISGRQIPQSQVMLLRYGWARGQFVPDPTPGWVPVEVTWTVVGDDSWWWQEEGERYEATLTGFDATFRVEGSAFREVILTADDARWPEAGEDPLAPEDRAETTLELVR